MPEPVYTAGIRYGTEEVKKMDLALQASFFFSRRICFSAICVLLIVGGMGIGLQTAAGLCSLLAGCFLLPHAGALHSARARNVLRALRGKALPMRYEFYGDRFVCSAGDTNTEYDYQKVIRLIDGKDYLYLCLKPQQACMIDVKTLEPAGTEWFKKEIARRVGLQWTKPLSWGSLNLRTIRFNRSNTRGLQRKG